MKKYNKAVWGGVAAAVTTIFAGLLKQFVPEFEFGPEMQGALTTIITVIVVYAVPNANPGEGDQVVEDTG